MLPSRFDNGLQSSSRELVAVFGADYIEYRERVAMIDPGPALRSDQVQPHPSARAIVSAGLGGCPILAPGAIGRGVSARGFRRSFIGWPSALTAARRRLDRHAGGSRHQIELEVDIFRSAVGISLGPHADEAVAQAPPSALFVPSRYDLAATRRHIQAISS
jgi:hypothetical protein